MIKIKTISFFLVLIISCCIFIKPCHAQYDPTKVKSDTLIRAALAFDDRQVDLNFESSVGSAFASLLVQTFKSLEPLPLLKINNLSDNDKAKLDALYKYLFLLRKNPPNWRTLIIMEEERATANSKMNNSKSTGK
jgi:hypothetical protein